MPAQDGIDTSREASSTMLSSGAAPGIGYSAAALWAVRSGVSV